MIHDLNQLLNNLYGLDTMSIQMSDVEKMFAVLTCRHSKYLKANPTHAIPVEMQRIFSSASLSLREATTIRQMVLDLMAMANITQRYPPPGTTRQFMSPLLALHLLFVEKSACANPSTVDCFVASFAKACKRRGYQQEISDFLDRGWWDPERLIPDNSALVSYFHCRMGGITHYDAMKVMRIEVAWSEDDK